MPRARLPTLLTVLGLSLVALYHRGAVQAWAYDSGPSKKQGARAPELPAGTVTLDGAQLRIADLRGQVVLLHFWTFACGNCEHMLPSYTAWDDKYRGRGLRVVGVHTPELPHERNVTTLRRIVKDKGIRWPVISDLGETVWDSYGVHAWPTVFLIDRAGNIAATFVGDDSARAIEAQIEKLL